MNALIALVLNLLKHRHTHVHFGRISNYSKTFGRAVYNWSNVFSE